MLNKVSSLARVVGIVLAIVAGFVALGSLDTTLVLVVLGLIAGLSLTADRMVLTGVMVLVLPAIGAALAIIPGIGAQLLAVTGNLAMLAAASLGTAFALLIYERVKSELGSLTAK